MDWDAYPAVAFKQGEVVVKKNGEIFSEDNLEPLMHPIISEAMAIASASLDSHTSGDDHINEVTVTEFFSMDWGGHIDENGKYQLLVYVHLRAEHEDSCIHWEGRDGYRVGYIGYCYMTKWFLFDGEKAVEWSQVTERGCYAFTYGWYPIIHNNWRETDEWFAQDHSFKVMIGDGYNFTVGNLSAFCKKWTTSTGCELRFYNDKDEYLCSIDGSPGSKTAVCVIGTGRYLIAHQLSLYLWNNGELSKLTGSIYSLRLRKMPNLRKFKKAGNAHKESQT